MGERGEEVWEGRVGPGFRTVQKLGEVRPFGRGRNEVVPTQRWADEQLPENTTVFSGIFVPKIRKFPAHGATVWGLSPHAAKDDQEGALKRERQQKPWFHQADPTVGRSRCPAQREIPAPTRAGGSQDARGRAPAEFSSRIRRSSSAQASDRSLCRLSPRKP